MQVLRPLSLSLGLLASDHMHAVMSPSQEQSVTCTAVRLVTSIPQLCSAPQLTLSGRLLIILHLHIQPVCTTPRLFVRILSQ